MRPKKNLEPLRNNRPSMKIRSTRSREQQDQLHRPGQSAQRLPSERLREPHIPSLPRRPHWEPASVGDSGDNSGAGWYCGPDDSPGL